jgi:predicted ribosomally synthesized peptide with SipW-like signal peptide
MSKDDTPTRGNTGIKLAVTLALLAVLGVAVGFGTWSAFSSTASNAGNSFQAGTVVLSDNGPLASSPMLSFSNAKPGDSATSCINVSYTGTLPASVRLYGTTAGTGLDPYLNLTVTRGSGAAAFADCTGFTADATNYTGAGNGVVYNGTLQGFANSYATGLVDPTSGTPAVWTNGQSHTYKFVVAVQDNNAAQGKTATQTFTWEARNN